MTSIHNNYTFNRSSGSTNSTSGSTSTQQKPSLNNTATNVLGQSLRGRTESPVTQRKFNTGQVANAISRLPPSMTSSRHQHQQQLLKSSQLPQQVQPLNSSSSNTTTSTSNHIEYSSNSIHSNNNKAVLQPNTRRSSFRSLIVDPDQDDPKTVSSISNSKQHKSIAQSIDQRSSSNKPNKYTSIYTTLSQPTQVQTTVTAANFNREDLNSNFLLLKLNDPYLPINGTSTYLPSNQKISNNENTSAPISRSQSHQHQHQQQQQQQQQQSVSSTRQANPKISIGSGSRTGSATNHNENVVHEYRSHNSYNHNGVSNSEPAQFYSPAAANITSSSSSSSYKSSNQMPSSSSLSSNSSSTTKYNIINNSNNNNNNNSSKEARHEGHELESKGIVGLKNLGNTCFMNSILQCLSNTRCLLEYCITNAYTDDINTTLSVMKGSLFNSYATLIKTMWKSENIVSPQDFKSQIARFAPRFVGYAQQDAEEFLYYLLKGLHEDVNLVKKKPSPFRFDEKAWDRMNDAEKSKEHWDMNLRTDNSRISDMFVGQLKSTLKCTKCDYKSPTYELFWHLALPIPTKSTSVKLDDCLRLFMSEEILDGDNKPVCSRCNEKRRCTKRYSIDKLPKILVIHLKRFSKIRFNNKINLNVDYPVESLDMSKYLSENIELSSSSIRNCIYDLYGISLHSGTESSGHYVAYCKHPFKKRWYCYNDSQVREINHTALQDSDAYILFYQLRSRSSD